MSTLQRIFEKGALACACKLAQYEVRAGVRSSHPLKNKMNLRSDGIFNLRFRAARGWDLNVISTMLVNDVSTIKPNDMATWVGDLLRMSIMPSITLPVFSFIIIDLFPACG